MIKIVTDSSLTIAPELIESLGITVVPLSVMIDGQLYSDNDLKEQGVFLELMKKSQNLPKTSQPPVGLFAEYYEKLATQDDEIISIHLTHALSGTIEAARQGAQLSGRQVTIIDSAFTDQALAFQVVAAAKAAKAGKSVSEILATIEQVREKTKLYIGVSTLENLVKGGRIGRVTGLLSSLLNIKVVMELHQHALTPIVKGRGTKTFTKWLDSLITDIKGKAIEEIGISYSGTPEFAVSIKEKLEATVDTSITLLETGSVIQTHTGEGAFAIMIHYA